MQGSHSAIFKAKIVNGKVRVCYGLFGKTSRYTSAATGHSAELNTMEIHQVENVIDVDVL